MINNFQDKLLEIVMDDNNNKDENVEKVMWLTTALLEKGKIIEIMKNNIDDKNKELFIIKKKETVYVNVQKYMYPNKNKENSQEKVMLRNKVMKKMPKNGRK